MISHRDQATLDAGNGLSRHWPVGINSVFQMIVKQSEQGSRSDERDTQRYPTLSCVGVLNAVLACFDGLDGDMLPLSPMPPVEAIVSTSMSLRYAYQKA